MIYSPGVNGLVPDMFRVTVPAPVAGEQLPLAGVTPGEDVLFV
jgi:hypothetical protein